MQKPDLNGALAVFALCACSTSGTPSEPPSPSHDETIIDAGTPAQSPTALPPQPKPPAFDRLRPTGVLAFANGTPPRLSLIELNHGGVTPLATKAGSSEMPSFDETGKKLLYVHTDNATHTIRQLDIETANDALVASCGAPCETPRFATDGSVWFVERPADNKPIQIMRLALKATTATPWSVDLSSCTIRSFDLSFEGDRIVLSLDAKSAGPLCTTDKVGIFVLPLDGTSLPPAIKIADVQIKADSPISRATIWTATKTIMFVAFRAKDGDDTVFERDDSGKISFSNFGDAFSVMRDGEQRGDHLVYHFARGRFPDGTRFINASGGNLGYYLTIVPGTGVNETYSNTLGLFSWGHAPIPGRP